ncbi:D-beta-D-heptose 7-phosphate kinase / D-beta-D-heptose 1-phosphate adenosyltransferase [Mariprofundus micogutta]|uniref:D-beta-D-heptose 7-phosphate kinase / D-beta-D-heptose 1-phosphate adenosyltransferase n=1 Tax=Mariprofundus micogutta TaxID=1921010 RepID=A0A1L8CN14_9PROT|nr:D-glycero-beta-D-manno-heptose-7-phosphate kinase [Mariprofundus micogutta]GAV20308.1 D-beta-D-heptose 7-phosphate kinase / D-beta-D-heptose 1-phosphate adenosyltransferase [Mariprofundus micogutta]
MILVIGDIIVDEFIWGDVSRISPEAPVPVVSVNEIDRRLGGSSNVVRNLHALDTGSAMFGIVGNDEPGEWVKNRLAELNSDNSGVITKTNDRPTAIKTRIIARHQQVVRYDREWTQAARQESHEAIMASLEDLLPQSSATILSDYGKGVLTPDFIRQLIEQMQGSIIAVDPKPEHTDAYAGATVITPNLMEAAAMAGLEAINDDEHAELIAQTLHAKLNLQYVLLTRSERGMTLYDGQQSHHIPTAARDVFDVTGAGDTVIAVFTACLARGDDALTAVKLANQAAGVVVGKVGTATASWSEIEAH